MISLISFRLPILVLVSGPGFKELGITFPGKLYLKFQSYHAVLEKEHSFYSVGMLPMLHNWRQDWQRDRADSVPLPPFGILRTLQLMCDILLRTSYHIFQRLILSTNFQSWQEAYLLQKRIWHPLYGSSSCSNIPTSTSQYTYKYPFFFTQKKNNYSFTLTFPKEESDLSILSLWTTAVKMYIVTRIST